MKKLNLESETKPEEGNKTWRRKLNPEIETKPRGGNKTGEGN